MSSGRPPIKATTVRLGTDLLRLLEAEAQDAGVSVSQYIRQSALARAAAASAARDTARSNCSRARYAR
jgi:Ribbon-helix-helix protein, copG family